MKKKLLYLFLAGLVVIHFGCNVPGVEIIFNLTNGTGSYSAATNESTFQVTGNVFIKQSNVVNTSLTAQFINWGFRIKQGDTLIVDINDGNYLTILGLVFTNTSDWESGDLWVYLETIMPVIGDLYSGSHPDTVEFYGLIWDENDNRYNVSGTGPFNFTRN